MTTVPVEQLPPELRQKASIVSADTPRPVDYFDASSSRWVTLPDGVQRVEVKTLSEGERKNYLNVTNRDVTMNARTRDLKMKGAAGDDEHALIRLAVVDWEVQRSGNPVPFSTRALNDALDSFPPSVWQAVLREIRKDNDWLLGTEDDLEALEAERDDLDARIKTLRERSGK